jgi:hypothetical protein
MSKQHILVVASLLITAFFLPGQSNAQTGLVDPRTTTYVCVLSRTVPWGNENAGAFDVITTGTSGVQVVSVLPCEAASVRGDRLSEADYAVLERMQLLRILFSTLKVRLKSESEALTTRADFIKHAKDVCAHHPKIALLPLDWESDAKALYANSGVGGPGSVPLRTCNALTK